MKKVAKENSKQLTILALIVALGTYLRFWKLQENMPFIGDFGWYYLQARDFIQGEHLPLIGIPSSIPVLKQGVLWTYLLSFALWIGNFNPISGGILSSLFGVIGVFGTCLTLSTFFTRKIGLIAALIAATFPFIVFLDRAPFQTAAIYPMSLLFAWFSYSVWKKKTGTNLLITGLVWGFTFQLELAAILLIPVLFISLWLSERRLELKDFAVFFTGAFWGIFPFLLYDLESGVYMQTVGFAFWFVTKIYERFFALIGLILVFLVFWNYFSRFKKLSFPKVFVLVWIVVGFGAIYIKGNVSDAYLPLIYFPSIGIMAIIFDRVLTKWWFASFLLFIFVLTNLFQFKEKIGKGILPGLSEQIEVVDYLVGKGEMKINVYYVGPGDQFESGVANWEYLLWWKGLEIDRNSEKQYAIITNQIKNPPGFTVVKDFENVYVAEKNDY